MCGIVLAKFPNTRNVLGKGTNNFTKTLMKRCRGICKQVLALTAFGKDKKGRYGLRSQCKACRNEKAKERYKDDPEKILASQRKWKKNNPEKVNAICQEVADQNNPEIGKSICKEVQSETVQQKEKKCTEKKTL